MFSVTVSYVAATAEWKLVHQMEQASDDCHYCYWPIYLCKLHCNLFFTFRQEKKCLARHLSLAGQKNKKQIAETNTKSLKQLRLGAPDGYSITSTCTIMPNLVNK